MKIFIFDLETTGLLEYRHGIHQISYRILDENGKEVVTRDLKVRPHPKALIESAALEVAKVTEEQIQSYPYSMKEAYDIIVADLKGVCDKFNKKDKLYLAGYNNSNFDNRFLRAFFIQNGDQYFGSYFYSNCFDAMVHATPVLLKSREEMSNFKLATVALALGIMVEEEKLHDATYDLHLTFEILKKTVPEIAVYAKGKD